MFTINMRIRRYNYKLQKSKVEFLEDSRKEHSIQITTTKGNSKQQTLSKTEGK